MSKRFKFITLVFLAVCLTVSTAVANGVGVVGAYQMPADGDDGYGGLLRYQWELPSETKSVRLFTQVGMLTGFGEDDRGTEDDVDLSMDIDIDVAPIEFGALFDLAMTQQGALYAGLGAGYYFIDNSLGADVDSGTFPGTVGVDANIDFEDEFGAFALIGWEHEISEKLSFFVEGRYTYLEADADAAITVTASETDGGSTFSETETISEKGEYDLSGFGVSVGLLCRW